MFWLCYNLDNGDNMHKRKIILVTCIMLLIYFIIGFTYLCGERVKFTINGNKEVNLNIGEEYKELGVQASLCVGRKCSDITEDIKIKENIDSSVIGKYEVVYKLKYKNKEYTEKRVVNVVDTEAPVIILKGQKTANVCPSKEYEEEGYEAIDNYDGDITDKVEIIKENDYIKYTVNDSSNNETSITRNIKIVDDENPVIKLKGNKTISLNLNDKYEEYGYTVSDNCGKIDSSKVQVTNNIDTSKEGTYKVTYKVEDKNGNIGTTTRTVKVIKPISFNTTNKNEYIDNLEKYIKDKNYNVSLGYVNLNTGYTYLYNKNVVYYGASLVKTVDALYVYEKMNFNESVRKKVEKAISVSDNTAHRELVNMIGINNLRSYGRSLGAKNFLTRSNNDYFGNTTVKDQIAIWKYLYKFVNNNAKGKELRKYFINSYYNFLLFDGIPTTMHKYGYYGSYYHDVGIVYADDPYIVVILTKHGNGNFKSIVQDLSKKIYGLNKIDN